MWLGVDLSMGTKEMCEIRLGDHNIIIIPNSIINVNWGRGWKEPI